MVRPFAEALPPGIHYVEVGGHGCIYNEAAVARELGVAPGPELHAAVRDAVDGEAFGLLLGYGAPSISTRPSHGVSIMRNGVEYYGFNSSADRSAAEHYARERMRDFSDAFPKDMWELIIKERPGSDGVHAAAYDSRAYVPSLTPDATYRTAAEWAELAPEMRAGKFFLACVEDERLLLDMHKLVDACMQEGVSEDEFIHRAFLMLGEITDPLTGRPYYDPARQMEEMTPEERIAYDNSVTHLDSRARLKLIYRTQRELAAGYAQWQNALEPNNLRRFPAWRFVRQPGARTKRPDHVEHENEVRLISDTAYWLARNSPDQGGFNQPFPPFGYNSWMRVERVSRKEAIKLGLLAKDEEPTPPPDAHRWSLRKIIEQANTASLDSLPPESVERIKTRCREAGLELLPADTGGYTAKPAPAAPFIPFSDDLEEELNDLLRMLEETATPPAPAAPSIPWLSSLFGKLLPPDDPGDVYAANPYGCNQHRHGEGCPHADGGVDPDLKKNLEAALRRARREDGTVEQGGELSRTHEVRLREMPEVMKALGEPDVPLVMTVHHIRKLASKHGLTVEQMQEVAAKLNDPLLVMQADVQKHLILLDMEAYEKRDKAMRPVICFVEKKPDKEHAEYVVSAYPLQKEKYGKVLGKQNKLLYCKFRDEKTAQFAADAPQCSEARDLVRAAIRSGFADSVLTGEDLVKRKKENNPRRHVNTKKKTERAKIPEDY